MKIIKYIIGLVLAVMFAALMSADASRWVNGEVGEYVGD